MKEKAKSKFFQGIFPALLTPVAEDGSILKNGLKDLIEWELNRGADGFYIGGATGECYCLELSEREILAEAAVEAVGDKGITIVHIGAQNVRGGIRLAKQAMEVGADAISATPPPIYTYAPLEIAEYYRRLAEAVEIPMIVYANAMFQGQNFLQLMELLMEIPNVQGVKFTRNSYYEMHQLCCLRKEKIHILNGPDETLICGLMMGAEGGIGSTYNIMPGVYQKIYQAFLQKDMDRAQKWQFFADDVIGVLLRYGQIRAMKYLFERKKIFLGKAEKPTADLTKEEKAGLLEALRGVGYFKEYPEME